MRDICKKCTKIAHPKVTPDNHPFSSKSEGKRRRRKKLYYMSLNQTKYWYHDERHL